MFYIRDLKITAVIITVGFRNDTHYKELMYIKPVSNAGTFQETVSCMFFFRNFNHLDLFFFFFALET